VGKGDPPAADWRTRRDRAVALREELALSLATGRALDAGAVAAAWDKLVSRARARLLAIPSKCAGSVPAGVRTQVFELVTKLIHEALQELADSKGNGHDDEN